MTVTEDFQLAIKTGKFKEALLLLISQSFDLSVTTSASEQMKLQTHINAVEGEINHQIDPDSLENSHYQLLEKIHQEQVRMAPEVMLQYVKNWHYLSRLLASWEDLPSPSQPAKRLKREQSVSLPEDKSTPENEWSEMLEEVQNVEVIDVEETDEEEEDWGDWMEEEEDWETRDNNQGEPKPKND